MHFQKQNNHCQGITTHARRSLVMASLQAPEGNAGVSPGKILVITLKHFPFHVDFLKCTGYNLIYFSEVFTTVVQLICTTHVQFSILFLRIVSCQLLLLPNVVSATSSTYLFFLPFICLIQFSIEQRVLQYTI